MRIEKRLLLGITALVVGLTLAAPAWASESVAAERDHDVTRADAEEIDISQVGLLAVLGDTDNPVVARVLSGGGLDRSIEDAADALTRPEQRARPHLATRGTSIITTVMLAP